MGLFDNFKTKKAEARLIEEALYQEALNEVEQGIRRDGIWAKAIVDSNGEESKARALYLKYRVRSLIDESKLKNEQILRVQRSEQQRDAAEAAQTKKALRKQYPFGVPLYYDDNNGP